MSDESAFYRLIRPSHNPTGLSSTQGCQLEGQGGPPCSCPSGAACSGPVAKHQLVLFGGNGVPGMRVIGILCLAVFSLSSASSAGWRGGRTELCASVSAGCLEHELQTRALIWQDRHRPAGLRSGQLGFSGSGGRDSLCGHHRTGTRGRPASAWEA